MEKRIAKVEMLETDLIEKQLQVEDYIQSIGKSELRTMFRLCKQHDSHEKNP